MHRNPIDVYPRELILEVELYYGDRLAALLGLNPKHNYIEDILSGITVLYGRFPLSDKTKHGAVFGCDYSSRNSSDYITIFYRTVDVSTFDQLTVMRFTVDHGFKLVTESHRIWRVKNTTHYTFFFKRIDDAVKDVIDNTDKPEDIVAVML